MIIPPPETAGRRRAKLAARHIAPQAEFAWVSDLYRQKAVAIPLPR